MNDTLNNFDRNERLTIFFTALYAIHGVDADGCALSFDAAVELGVGQTEALLVFWEKRGAA